MHGIHHQVLPQLKTFKSSNYHRKTQIKLHCSISFSAEMVCPKQNFPQLWFHHLITQINTCKATASLSHLWSSIFIPEKFTSQQASSHTKFWKISAPSRLSHTRQVWWFWLGVVASTDGGGSWWCCSREVGCKWSWWFPDLFPQLTDRAGTKWNCSSRLLPLVDTHEEQLSLTCSRMLQWRWGAAVVWYVKWNEWSGAVVMEMFVGRIGGV